MGDSLESRFSAGSASAEPTTWYVSLPIGPSIVTCEPSTTSSELELTLLDHAGLAQALLELRDLRLEHGLLVLRVVVLGVLGDVAELARLRDARGNLLAPRRLQRLELFPELLVALTGEDDFLRQRILR